MEDDGKLGLVNIQGVAAAEPSRAAILVAAVAGVVAGTLSMAAGEYVSVSSQADTEPADLARERGELAASPEAEWAELTGIYTTRGLNRDLSIQVADQLMAQDALEGHAKDDLGMHEKTRARPIQAVLASAASFAAGAAPPALLAAKWTTTPRATLVDALYNHDYRLPEAGEPIPFVVNEYEPVFDAADFVRCGRDLFGIRSNVTNESGIHWLRTHLDERFRIT